jgi:hypothetical protein
VGEVTPSPAEVHVAAIGDVREHLHLPPSQALLVVQTKLEFPKTFDDPSNRIQEFLRSQRLT